MSPLDKNLHSHLASFLPLSDSLAIAQVNKAALPLIKPHLQRVQTRTKLMEEKAYDISDANLNHLNLAETVQSGPIAPKGIHFVLSSINIAVARLNYADEKPNQNDMAEFQQTLTDTTERLIATPECNELGRGEALKFAATSNNKELAQKILDKGPISKAEAKTARSLAHHNRYQPIIDMLEPFAD